MKGISDLKIIGVDENRPPTLRKEPYIELYFKLNHEAPKEWIRDFNELTANGQYPVKIKPEEGLFIETWVRKPEEIEAAFNAITNAFHTCIENFIARVAARMNADKASLNDKKLSDAQIALNKIIENLKFEKDE